jgi:hypothetical protein
MNLDNLKFESLYEETLGMFVDNELNPDELKLAREWIVEAEYVDPETDEPVTLERVNEESDEFIVDFIKHHYDGGIKGFKLAVNPRPSKDDNLEEKESKELKKACWKGYEAIGTKKKKGKTVPNCVPVKENSLETLEEAGRCTGPTQKASSDRKGKKWMQCVKNPSGKGYKRIHWGQAGVRVTGKSGNTKRKKSFKKRHNCSKAKPNTPKAMACKDWQ